MVDPNNNDSSALLQVLQQLSVEERAELLQALAFKDNDFTQFNFGQLKNIQVTLEQGDPANPVATVNLNNSLKIDQGTLRQILEQLAAQKQQFTTPYFYPSDLGSSNFVGRSDELEELHQWLQNSEPVAIAAATDMGGIGKTELAWQYARQCEQKGRYPAGIWWLAEPGTGLSSKILSYSLQMQIGQPPDNLTEEIARVRWCFDRWGEVLEGKRLLIFDDVTNYEAIQELLPQDECYHIVLTTRQVLDKPVRHLELKGLRPHDALNLLHRLTQGDERIESELGTATDLCEWMGQRPLGIELVGRYLVRKPDLTLVTLLDQL